MRVSYRYSRTSIQAVPCMRSRGHVSPMHAPCPHACPMPHARMQLRTSFAISSRLWRGVCPPPSSGSSRAWSKTMSKNTWGGEEDRYRCRGTFAALMTGQSEGWAAAAGQSTYQFLPQGPAGDYLPADVGETRHSAMSGLGGSSSVFSLPHTFSAGSDNQIGSRL